MKKIFWIPVAVLFFTIAISATGQTTWSLEKCVTYAIEHSLSIQQAQFAIRDAELLLMNSERSRLPNLNASTNGNIQFGRTIDPTTNAFRSESLSSNSVSLSTNILVYDGGRINQEVKQGRLDIKTALLDKEDAANTIALQVATAYLNILMAEEQLENALNRVKLSQGQLDRTDKLIQAGNLPVNDRLNLIAQIAADEQNVVVAQNAVANGYLTLKNLLLLEPQENMVVEKPVVEIPSDANPESFSLYDIYNVALRTQPQIKAGDLRLESAGIGVQMAKTNMYPQVGLGANINSFASSRGMSILGFKDGISEQTVFIDNTPVVVGFPTTIPITEKASYFDQINDNFGQSIGVSVNIPIYNRHANVILRDRAKIAMERQAVANQQAKQQLKSDVQLAIANAKSAKQSLEAAQKSVQAAQAAFDNDQRRFELGTINTLQFATSRNTLDVAQVELTRSKYQYLFNLKVVDFYMGKPLKL